MDNRTKTRRHAVIGAIATDFFLAAFLALILAETSILLSLSMALFVATGILLIAVLWIRGRNPVLPIEAQSENVEKPKQVWRFLAATGVLLVGFGETFLFGMVFIFLWFYCSRNQYFPRVILFIDYYNALFLPLLVSFFPVLHASQRQWLLLAGNILGPFLVFFLLGLWAAGIP